MKKWLLHLFLAIVTFFKLRHAKEELEEPLVEQTTPKCNQSVLLARLDAINQSVNSALDDSNDSALGVAPHLPDAPRHAFHDGLLDAHVESSTMYSSTPIMHGGLSLRRSRLQTPNSPM